MKNWSFLFHQLYSTKIEQYYEDGKIFYQFLADIHFDKSDSYFFNTTACGYNFINVLIHLRLWIDQVAKQYKFEPKEECQRFKLKWNAHWSKPVIIDDLEETWEEVYQNVLSREAWHFLL